VDRGVDRRPCKSQVQWVQSEHCGEASLQDRRTLQASVLLIICRSQDAELRRNGRSACISAIQPANLVSGNNRRSGSMRLREKVAQQLPLRRKNTGRIMEDYAFLRIYVSRRNALNSADSDVAEWRALSGCQAVLPARVWQPLAPAAPARHRVTADGSGQSAISPGQPTKRWSCAAPAITLQLMPASAGARG
jgi:hypothetical protein